MNYIKQLQTDNGEQARTIEEMREMIADLRDYVLSDKFQSNCELSGYVNIRDILLRIGAN